MSTVNVKAVCLELLVATAPTLIGGAFSDDVVLDAQPFHLLNGKRVVGEGRSWVSYLVLYQQDGLVRVRDTVLVRLDHCYLLPTRGSYCVFTHCSVTDGGKTAKENALFLLLRGLAQTTHLIPVTLFVT